MIRATVSTGSTRAGATAISLARSPNPARGDRPACGRPATSRRAVRGGRQMDLPGDREQTRYANRTRDQARKCGGRAVKAVERAGLKPAWVRRLARRLAKLGFPTRRT